MFLRSSRSGLHTSFAHHTRVGLLHTILKQQKQWRMKSVIILTWLTMRTSVHAPMKCVSCWHPFLQIKFTGYGAIVALIRSSDLKSMESLTAYYIEANEMCSSQRNVVMELLMLTRNVIAAHLQLARIHCVIQESANRALIEHANLDHAVTSTRINIAKLALNALQQ